MSVLKILLMGPRTLKRRPQCLRYHTMALLGYPRISSNISFLPFNSLMGRENKPVSNPYSWALVFPSEVIPIALFMHALLRHHKKTLLLGEAIAFFPSACLYCQKWPFLTSLISFLWFQKGAVPCSLKWNGVKCAWQNVWPLWGRNKESS